MNQQMTQSLNQQITQPMNPINQPMNQQMTQPLKSQSPSSLSYYSTQLTQPVYVQSYRSLEPNTAPQYSLLTAPSPSYPSYITQPLTMNYAYPVDEEPRRTRRIKSNHAVRVLKAAFAANPKPSKEAMRAWQGETGCTYTEICRWFRNERFRIRQETSKMSSGKSGGAGVSQSVNGQAGNGQFAGDQSGTQSAAQSNNESHAQQRSTSPHMTTPSSPASSVSVRSTASHTLPHADQSASHSHPKPEISEWIAQFQEEFSFDQQQRALAALLQKQHAANHAHHEHEVHQSQSSEVM
jgi:hypothetical protein